jgi:hypothetical protein
MADRLLEILHGIAILVPYSLYGFLFLALVDISRAKPIAWTRDLGKRGAIFFGTVSGVLMGATLFSVYAFSPAPPKWSSVIFIAVGNGLASIVMGWAYLVGPGGGALDSCHIANRYARRSGVEHAPIPMSRFYIMEWCVCMGCMLTFSWGWLTFARQYCGARLSPDLLQRFDLSSNNLYALVLFALLLYSAVVEEIFFRGYAMQWMLDRKWSRTLVVLLTAALWSLTHLHQIDPEWVKWVQIFGLGIVLGVARLRLGLEACVLLHLAFNFSIGFFVPKGL